MLKIWTPFAILPYNISPFFFSFWKTTISYSILGNLHLTTACMQFFLKIGKRFPNTTVMLYMKSTSMPNMTVQNGSTVVNAAGDIVFFAQQPGGKYTYFLTLSAVSTCSDDFNVHDIISFFLEYSIIFFCDILNRPVLFRRCPQRFQ